MTAAALASSRNVPLPAATRPAVAKAITRISQVVMPARRAASAVPPPA